MLPLQLSMREFERQARLNAFSWSLALYGALLWGLYGLYSIDTEVVKVQLGRAKPAAVRCLSSKSKKRHHFLKKRKAEHHQDRTSLGKNAATNGARSAVIPAQGARALKEEKRQKRLQAEREAAKLRAEHEALVRGRKKQAEAAKKAQLEKAAQERRAAESAKKAAAQKKVAAALAAKEREKAQKIAQSHVAPVLEEHEVKQNKVLQQVEREKARDLEKKIEKLEYEAAEAAEEEAQVAETQTEGTGSDEADEEEGNEDAVFGTGENPEELSPDGAALLYAIERVWRPPAGVRAQLTAQIRVSLRSDGAVLDAVIEKQSGVVAFDMAARAALWRVSYPNGLWGKTLVIIFGGTRGTQ